MGLESGTYISDLNASNPVGTDGKDEGDDHLRLIKSTILATFPNIDGAMSATEDELNLLASQEGAALLKGMADAAGTVDVITADFTPNISLTDNVIVIVRAAGANTSTTPTFNPDGLGAKTIVKEGNQALLADDIFGAGHRLILQYDASNDNWELLNPASNRTAWRGCLVYRTSNQAISTATETAIQFDNEDSDTDGAHDNVTNNSRITIPSGITRVRVKARAYFVYATSSNAGLRKLSLYKNGSIVTGAGETPSARKAFITGDSVDIYLATADITVSPGDYLEIFAYQDSGVSLNIGTGSASGVWFEVQYIL